MKKILNYIFLHYLPKIFPTFDTPNSVNELFLLKVRLYLVLYYHHYKKMYCILNLKTNSQLYIHNLNHKIL